MSQSTIARRYARAAIKTIAPDDQGTIDRVKDELSAFSSAVAASSELSALTKNPSFSREDREGVIKALVSEYKMSDVTERVLLLLNTKGRLEHVGEVATAFVKEADQLMKRVRLKITSAKKLDDAVLANVVKEVKAKTGREVVVETDIDENLVAGLKTEVGGEVLDGTLEGRLNRLERSLLK